MTSAFDGAVTPEQSWERVTALFSDILSSEGINEVYFEIVPNMLALITRLSQHGWKERYYASQSHERLLIRHFKHREMLLQSPFISVNPRQGGRFDCCFFRGRRRRGSPPTAEALGCDLAEAEQAMLQMGILLDQYREEIAPEGFGVPDD